MTGQYTPVARPPMSEAEAREFVSWAKDAQDELVRRVYEAYNRQAHLALGYGSWEEMCSGEGLGFYKLPRDKRAPAVVELKDHGMSNRAIGQALGVGKDTVARDLAPRSNSGANAPLKDHERVDYKAEAQDRRDMHTHEEAEPSERVTDARRDAFNHLRRAAIRANAVGRTDIRDKIHAFRRELESEW